MRRLPVLALLALALLAGTAQAGPRQISMMQDDDLLLYRDAATRDAALAQMRALGVDRVRVTVLWSVAARGVRSTPARRRRFAARTPRRTRARTGTATTTSCAAPARTGSASISP